MHSRASWIAIVAVLAACRVEGGSPPGQAAERPEQPPAHNFRFEAWPDSAPPSEHQVFDRRREQVAPGVVRLTLGALVRADRGQAAARAAMEAVADEARRQDSTLAAVRVLAYLPPTPGAPRGAMLQPLGYLDWVPPAGWDALTPTSVREFHRFDVVFLMDIPEPRPQRPN
jgi:hypothetical protein